MPQQNSPLSHHVIAVFDFDKTITSKDTFSRFLLYHAGVFRFLFGILLHLPFFLIYLFGWISRDWMKERLISHFFSGKSEGALIVKAKKFADKKIKKFVRKKAMERIHWHQAQGHRCILVSASLDIYLIPWAIKEGIHEVLATQLEFVEGVATGKINGKNCRGQEKVNRISKLIGLLEEYEIYAYGDSDGDREMLAIADHAFYRSFDEKNGRVS